MKYEAMVKYVIKVMTISNKIIMILKLMLVNLDLVMEEKASFT